MYHLNTFNPRSSLTRYIEYNFIILAQFLLFDWHWLYLVSEEQEEDNARQDCISYDLIIGMCFLKIL